MVEGQKKGTSEQPEIQINNSMITSNDVITVIIAGNGQDIVFVLSLVDRCVMYETYFALKQRPLELQALCSFAFEEQLSMERSILVASACAVSASALTYIACRYLSKEGSVRDETSEAHDGTETFLGRYLIQHYGRPDELLPYGFGPVDSLGFPARCARECIKHTEDTAPSIALDIGCSVGRSTFELSKRFNQVVGIDNSGAFIDASKKLKIYGKLDYTVQTEGSLVSQHTAEVDPDIDRSRVSFRHGDACNLPSDLGQFGCLLASNLIERIPNPYQFLDRLPSLVAPGGTLVITSTYSWREQFTPKNLWLGGYKDAEGKHVFGFDTLKRYLGSNFELVEDKHMPFLIRETAHKNSWGLSHMTIWKRKSSS